MIEKKQQAARRFASSFAPKTKLGLLVRNWVTDAMALPFIADIALGSSLRDDFALPNYG